MPSCRSPLQEPSAEGVTGEPCPASGQRDHRSVARIRKAVCDRTAARGRTRHRQQGSHNEFHPGFPRMIRAVQRPITLETVPLARKKIIFDRRHIMQHMTRAVDTVCKRKHRRLLLHGGGPMLLERSPTPSPPSLGLPSHRSRYPRCTRAILHNRLPASLIGPVGEASEVLDNSNR
jgi:hypothetical protein